MEAFPCAYPMQAELVVLNPIFYAIYIQLPQHSHIIPQFIISCGPPGTYDSEGSDCVCLFGFFIHAFITYGR